MDWTRHYPTFSFLDAESGGAAVDGHRIHVVKEVTIADIGCGFGGLLVALGPKFPDDLLLGSSTRVVVPWHSLDKHP